MKALCVGGPHDRKLVTVQPNVPPQDYSACHIDLGGETVSFYVHSTITPQKAVFMVFSAYANVKGR